LLYQKENTVSLAKASGMSPEELRNKLVVGVFVDRQQPDYQSHYEAVVTKARSEIK